jgi:hypothetical protein
MKNFLRSLAVTAAFTFSFLHPSPAHDHFAAGVETGGNGVADPGEALKFLDESFTAIVYPLRPTPPAPNGTPGSNFYGGYYVLDESALVGFSLTAASDGQADEPVAGHAATGSYIWLEIVSVDGPPGAQLGFWDHQRAYFANTPTITFTTGQPTGNYRYTLSDPIFPPDPPPGAIVTQGLDYDYFMVPGTVTALAFDPLEDPFGHVHERAWTVNQPGDYTVGIRLVDLGTNHNGGPIHAPSQIYYLHFRTFDPPVPAIAKSGTDVVLSWPSVSGLTYQIETSTDLLTWQPLTAPRYLTGTGGTLTRTRAIGSDTKRFFRLFEY